MGSFNKPFVFIFSTSDWVWEVRHLLSVVRFIANWVDIYKIVTEENKIFYNTQCIFYLHCRNFHNQASKRLLLCAGSVVCFFSDFPSLKLIFPPWSIAMLAACISSKACKSTNDMDVIHGMLMLKGAGRTDSGMLHWLMNELFPGHRSSIMLAYASLLIPESVADLDTLSSIQLLEFVWKSLLLRSVTFVAEGTFSGLAVLSAEWKFFIKEQAGNCWIISVVGRLHLLAPVTRIDCVPLSFFSCQELWIL